VQVAAVAVGFEVKYYYKQEERIGWLVLRQQLYSIYTYIFVLYMFRVSDQLIFFFLFSE